MKKPVMIVPLAIVLGFMAGCQDKAAMAEVEEQNKALVKRVYEELNKGNTEIFKELFAPKCDFYYPSNRSNPISLEQNIEGVTIGLRAFPDFNQRIEKLFAVGDRVIVRSIATGTHDGDFLSLPATVKI